MNIFYIIRVKIEIKGTTVMRWIGYFLLFLLCLFILLIFVKIKIRVVFQDGFKSDDERAREKR